MAISNLQEKLMFYTLQKSRITSQLSDIQMQQLIASRDIAAEQLEYNNKLSALYFDPEIGYGKEYYTEALAEYQSEHEFELSTINAWESELEVQKESLETQLNEIQAYETSWQKLMSNNIKVDFTFGGMGTGK